MLQAAASRRQINLETLINFLEWQTEAAQAIPDPSAKLHVLCKTLVSENQFKDYHPAAVEAPRICTGSAHSLSKNTDFCIKEHC